ncbi:MAG: hypothetical protein FJY20_08150 [Bacteroidetes bacterium]|nr:hypothetical protein [Bacteroidota bacterium]
MDQGLWVGYKWIEPKSFYNRIFLNSNWRFSKLLKPIGDIDQQYQEANVNFNINIQSKKLWWLGSFTNLMFRGNDFYEPRKNGWFFRRGARLVFGGWFESNEAKKYSFSSEVFTRTFFNFYNGFSYQVSLRQQYRFNNKLTVSHRINTNPWFNNIGYAFVPNSSEINFARRRRNTIENILFVKYSFTNKMGLTFRARHYLSNVYNKKFYLLQKDGSLKPAAFVNEADQNFNLFNIDMVYTWQFAPGSFINIVWKDAAQHFTRNVEDSYFKNFRQTIESDQNNNISLKVIYFLDYLELKKLKKKKRQ